MASLSWLAVPALWMAVAPGAIQEDESQLDRFLRLAREGSPVVRPQAARRLVGLGEAAAERVLELSGGTPAGLAGLGADVIEVLGELEHAPLRAALWQALEDPDFPWRPAASRTLAKTALGDEGGRFTDLLADPLAAVRGAAVGGLGTLGDRAVRPKVEALLADPHDRVRREAAVLLDAWGSTCALAYLIEDLRRVDRFFDQDTGKAARFEALRLLQGRLGETYGFAPEKDPGTTENRAALTRFEARLVAEGCRELPDLPRVARAGPRAEGEVLGLEVRSCRRGEYFLRWTADDRLLVGTGNARVLELPEGTTAALVSAIEQHLATLGEERFWGAPGCDSEVYYLVRGGEERPTVLRVSKGPDAVDGLRPAVLGNWARALADSLDRASGSQASADLSSALRSALAAVGGSLPHAEIDED